VCDAHTHLCVCVRGREGWELLVGMSIRVCIIRTGMHHSYTLPATSARPTLHINIHTHHTSSMHGNTTCTGSHPSTRRENAREWSCTFSIMMTYPFAPAPDFQRVRGRFKEALRVLAGVTVFEIGRSFVRSRDNFKTVSVRVWCACTTNWSKPARTAFAKAGSNLYLRNVVVFQYIRSEAERPLTQNIIQSRSRTSVVCPP